MKDAYEHMRSKPGDPPTPRQAEIYSLILKYFAEHGLPPTIRELAVAAGIGSPNGVVVNLVALHKKGLIIFEQERTARGIAIPAITKATRDAASKLLTSMNRRPLATTDSLGRGVLAKDARRSRQ